MQFSSMKSYFTGRNIQWSFIPQSQVINEEQITEQK